MRLTLSILSAALLATGTVAQKCLGQSCEIANLSGSTGKPFVAEGKGGDPKGGSKAGWKCIAKYTEYGAGKVSTKGEAPSRIQGRQDGSCKPYTLLYARGTGEAGTMGGTVGPLLQSGLNSAQRGKWDIRGISYSADIAGDDCIGLPGGVKCMTVLNKIAQTCPQTKVVVSGYSQGAMVARNCVGFASDAAKKQVSGVVVFGDPFNGAPIKGFPQEKIKTFCASGDGVCKGEFKITAAHLSYTGTSTSAAVKWISQAVSGGT